MIFTKVGENIFVAKKDNQQIGCARLTSFNCYECVITISNEWQDLIKPLSDYEKVLHFRHDFNVNCQKIVLLNNKLGWFTGSNMSVEEALTHS